MLIQQYEMFKMLDHENIDDMATRFMHIINKISVRRFGYDSLRWFTNDLILRDNSQISYTSVSSLDG